MRIFLPQDTDFSSNGEKAVNPFSCIEHRESTAWYVLAKFGLEDVDLLKQDYILIVETKEKGNQPFRIHNIEVGSYIHVTAHHIGYDTKHYAVELSTVLNGNANACLVELKSNIMPSVTPFVFSSNVTTLKSFSVIDVSLYEALTQIASEYNAYLDFDGWNVYILDSMGQDRGINIEYGKNLESAQVTEDWELVVTKLKPIGNNGITLTPEWLTADISYAKPYTKIMQFDTDSLASLGLVAQLYLDRYKYPRINYSVQSSLASDGIATISVNTHGQLEAYTHEQLAEFTHAQLASTSNSAYFGLGDTIYVKARQFTVLTDVISYDYNVLTKYVVGIEFGNYRPTVKNFFNEMLSNVEEKTVKRTQVKIDEVNQEISLAVGDIGLLQGNVTTLNGQVGTLNGSVSQLLIDVDNVEISVTKYNNGELTGTYYNFDGDAFTITNSLDEVVFSADNQGNLTLVGDIKGVKDGVTRVELDEDSLIFNSETTTNIGMLKAFDSGGYKLFSISDGATYGVGSRLELSKSLGSVKIYSAKMEAVLGTSNGTNDASINVQASESGFFSSQLRASTNKNTNIESGYITASESGCSLWATKIDINTFNYLSQANIRASVDGTITLDSSTGSYQIRSSGVMKSIWVDANGFLRAS